MVLAGSAWYFWSLGSVPKVDYGQAVLDIERGTVEVRRASDPDWKPGKDGDTLRSGDSLRTGIDGLAVVTFFDLTQSRLGPGSLIRIAELEKPTQANALSIRLELESGRLWSHILRLFELDDAYSVSVQNVVATVRGTTFDLERQASGLALSVTESAVELVGAAPRAEGQDQSLVIGEGFTVKLDDQGKIGQTASLTDEMLEVGWFDENRHKDQVFETEAGRRLADQLDALGGTSPDSLFDYVARLSESAHLRLAQDEAPELYSRYVERRLYGAKKLIEQGRSGAAFAALTRLEDELAAKLGGADGAAYRRPLNRSFSTVMRLFSGVGPSSPLYRMKQRLEDIQISFASGDQVEQAYARLRAIDARLDEASMLIVLSSLDEAKVALDAARQGLTNVERDIDRLPETVDAVRLNALRGKLNVLKAREAAYRVRLATAIEPPQSEINFSGEPATSTADTLPSTSTAAATTTPYENILVSASPGNPYVGQEAAVRVRALKADGSSVDVTALSRFSFTGPANMNGPVVTPTGVGKIAVTARFEDGDALFEGQVVLDARQAPLTLEALRLEPAQPVDVAFGQSVPLKAVAVYSDGSSKDVTASAKFSTSNLILGYMSGSVFVAGKEAEGVVRVSGAYEEGTKRITAFRDFNVARR